MANSRIVLDPDIRAVVDQIQSKTRTASPSQAIALMVSRYGRHLIETWELDPNRYPDPSPSSSYSAAEPPAIAPAAESASTDFRFTEPIEL
ncbi:hypothetical protein H6F93_31960 [Leptolyngbya sp. FACHB-671]|uniref:hypothetical protein n=1 Tax=Leptolyngbya sp. FACHB-671 TaxID=2692812 RepID=UPI001682D0E0|nr:hypothetical protein [Leptolyngbya sp. FACHB-671]MBD2072085.1 hypothetical protein [Leptolyngbya sp. FACHB-671]